MVFEVKPAGKAPTELSRLWRDAFEAYNDTVGKKGLKLELDGGHLVASLADVVGSIDTSKKSFEKWRHDGGNWDKAVYFIGKNLDYAQRIGDQIASSAAASFPPASAIWTVATYAIKACQAQSKDYDQLLSLIGEAGSFLKTLQIIEDNFPDCDCYAECVTDAFTALIIVFAIQTKYMWEGRPLKFLHTLAQGGSDAKLSAAYGDVTTAISRLSRANGLIAVRNTEDIKTLVGSLGEKVDFIHEEMMVYFQDQGKRIEAGFDLQELNFQQQSASLASIQRGIRELKSQLSQDTNAETATRPTTDGVPGKSVALNIAKHFFGTPPSPLAKFKELRRSFVPGTDSWLYENKKYQEWQDGDTNFLWITGEPGLGKTHLAYSIIESLRTKTNKDPQTSVAYYFFQQENEPFRSVKSALQSIGLQIVTENHKLCESLASGVSDISSAKWSLLNIWLWTIDKLYKEETNDRLFLIIDSLEQANPAQARELLAFTEGIVALKQKIKVAFTGNDFEELSIWRKYVDKDLATISIDPSAARSGMQKLLESRFESLPRLSKFSDHVKAEIAKAIAEGKYGLQYADRILQYLDSKGLERPAMRALDELPGDLFCFYNNVLTKCSNNLKEQERLSLKLIFAWIAFAERPLTLEEAYSLFELKFGNLIDLETEIAGRCSSILDMSSTLVWEEHIQKRQRNEVVHKGSNVEGPSDHKVGIVASRDKYQPDSSLLLHFQENTLRDYMRSANVPNSTLRMSPLLSHVDIFTTCTEVLCSPEESEALGNADARQTLQKYAANYWMAHFKQIIYIATSKTDGDQEQTYTVSAPDAVVIQVIQGFSSISSNTNDVVKKLLQYNAISCYDDFNDKGVSYFIQLWVQKALECSPNLLGEEVRLWAQRAVENPAQFLQPLARGHVIHWFTEIHEETASRAFKFAWQAFITRNIDVNPPFQEKKDDQSFCQENEVEASGDDNDAFEEDDIASCEYQLTSAFEDIVVGPSGYRAIGLTLLSAWPFDALEAFNESLELCETDIDKFATLAAMAKCHHGIADHVDDAYDTACKALALDRSGLGKEYDDLLHTALLVRATYESGHNMLEAAVESLQEAMTVYSGDRRKTAEDFCMLLRTLDKLGRHEDILASIVKWGPIRLAVTAENRAEVNMWYQKAAKQTGQEQVMMMTYELLVQELAPLDWASPTRYQYALGCRRSIGDRAKAKSLLYEILDADDCIDPATDAVSDSIPYLARRELAEIIYEEFLQATSSAQKRASLSEIEGLAGRKLGNAHLTSDVQSNFLQRPEATILARMYRRFGPLDKFEETLTDAFNNCLASLKDQNPWNDSDTLRELCNVLACLPGLQREAAIALSAQFYHVDKELMMKSLDLISRFRELDDGIGLKNDSDGDWEDTDNDGEEQDEDEDDDAANANSEHLDKMPQGPGKKDWIRAIVNNDANDQYDIKGHRGIRCSGYCLNNPGDITSWDQTVMYHCVVCTDCDWCETCYLKRVANSGSSKGEKWRAYCGAGHEFIRGPAEGWLGIKDGKVELKDKEPEKFQEWLACLEREKWPKAWNEYWEG